MKVLQWKEFGMAGIMCRRKLEGGKSLIEGMERRGIICPLYGSDRAFMLSGLCQRKGFEMEICRSV